MHLCTVRKPSEGDSAFRTRGVTLREDAVSADPGLFGRAGEVVVAQLALRGPDDTEYLSGQRFQGSGPEVSIPYHAGVRTVD